MKAMVLESIAPITDVPLRFRDYPDPVPGEGEVRIKVACCAVCRTDLHVIEGDLPQPKLPLVPGHQVVGVVDQVGDGCSRLKTGDRVGIAWLRQVCGNCEYCNSNRENLCSSQRFTGYHEDGGYAELAVAAEDFVYPIPDGFGDPDATPLLCGGIIGYRALDRCNLPVNGKLALYGFGSSAHIVIQIAVYRGCDVYVVSRGESHQEHARKLGAVWAGNDPSRMPVKADSAIVFAPVGKLVLPALEMLRPGGTLALAGIYMSDIPRMSYEKHLFYERDVRSVTANTREDGRRLLAEAASIPVRPDVTTYDLCDANRALIDLKTGRLDGTGVLVVNAGGESSELRA